MSDAGSAGGKRRLWTRLIFHRAESDDAAQPSSVNGVGRQAKPVHILCDLFISKKAKLKKKDVPVSTHSRQKDTKEPNSQIFTLASV